MRTVREDPVRKGLLYAGTEGGVYVSWDGGENWQALQLNLPVVPITDLAVRDHDLIAATQGRSFWILDDLALLRQMQPDVSVHQHASVSPRRRVSAGTTQLPTCSDGLGQNPPRGAVVTYYFQQKPTGPVKLEFEEQDGKPIKSFSDMPAEAGMNRFEWDLRYPDAHGIAGGSHLSGGNLRGGPVAAPGSYRVKLIAGQDEVQSFDILKDPRLPTTNEQYQKQFALLMSIRDKLTAADDAFNRIHLAEAQLKNSDDTAASKTIAALDGIAHELVQAQFTGFDDQMLVYSLKLNNRIAALQGYVEGGYAPTDQDYQVFNELSADLEDILSKLKHVFNSAALASSSGVAKDSVAVKQ